MIHNSELRQDLVSGDWIIIAPGRSKRPREIAKRYPARKLALKKGCHFEDPQKFDNKKPILIYPNQHSWALQVVPNKYPALDHRGAACGVKSQYGPYSILPGIGHHDLLITRDHQKNFPKLAKDGAGLVFQAFRDRYLMLYGDQCITYVSMFHNWGPMAGASVYHPHYQMIAMSVVPPDVQHSLNGSARYFKENKKCVHCVMVEFEKREKSRIIVENAGAIAFAPYFSRSPFEVRIFPKKHLPYFENSYDSDIDSVVELLQKTLRLMEAHLHDPDYNFFIHTAPIRDKKNYAHYHWHIEIAPKLSIAAGFELSTGLDINVVDPDEAAKILR